MGMVTKHYERSLALVLALVVPASVAVADAPVTTQGAARRAGRSNQGPDRTLA
jgi:hypothetical protein